MNLKNKVLLIGSSYGCLSFIKFLKQRNFYVGVVGKHKSDPCHFYSDKSFYFDYSKKNIVKDIVEKYNFEYVVPTSNDASYLSFLDFKNPEKFSGIDNKLNIKIFHNKDVFKNFLIQNNIKTPKRYNENSLINFKNKIIIKPDDSFSGKGISVISDFKYFQEAKNKASKFSSNNKIIIEDYIEGSLHSISSFVSNKKVIFSFIVDEFCKTYDYQVDFSYFPSLLKKKIFDKVEKIIGNLVRLSSPKDGLIHTQFIVDKNNEIWLIESMRRCPGDLYPKLIEKYFNIDYSALFVMPFVGMNYNNLNLNFNICDKIIARHTISNSEDSIFESFKFNHPVNNFEFYPLKLSGSKLLKAPEDKAGILFIEFPKTSFDINLSYSIKNKLIIND